MQCNIGFAELAVNLPDVHVEITVPVLVEMLTDIPHIDFDKTLSWEGKCCRLSYILYFLNLYRMGTT